MFGSGFRLALVAFVLLATPAHGEVVRNSAFGFTLVKPKGWHGVSDQAYRVSVDQQNVTPEEKKQALQSPPIVAFTKIKEPTKSQNSAFMMRAVRIPGSQNVDPAAFLTAILSQQSQRTPGMTIVSAPRQTTVGGVRAAHARFHSEPVVVHGRYKATHEFWLIPRDGVILMIDAQTKRDDKTGAMNMLRSTVESIKFER